MLRRLLLPVFITLLMVTFCSLAYASVTVDSSSGGGGATIITPTLLGGVQPSTTINTTDIVTEIENAVGSVIGLIVVAVLGWIGNHIKNENIRKALDDAVERGGKGVYESIIAAGKNFQNVDVKNAALATSVNDILKLLPDAVKHFGLSPDDIKSMVRKELGGLLAVDPTVTITPQQVLAAAVPVPPGQYVVQAIGAGGAVNGAPAAATGEGTKTTDKASDSLGAANLAPSGGNPPLPPTYQPLPPVIT